MSCGSLLLTAPESQVQFSDFAAAPGNIPPILFLGKSVPRLSGAGPQMSPNAWTTSLPLQETSVNYH